MTPKEKQHISGLNDKLPGGLKMRLVDNGLDESAGLNAFCSDLTKLAPRIHLSREKAEDQPTPLLQVTDSIAYRGVPSGTEFEPFIELLSAAANVDAAVTRQPVERLKAIEAPAILKLYVSSMCPHCPAMVRQLYPLSLSNSNLKLTIIDGPAFPALAEIDKIMSVPTLILDDNFRWTAAVETDELLRIIGSRNPAELGAESLKSIIQDGDAYRLSDMMIADKLIFPAFFDLLTHAEFSVRLGAMAAIEDVAEKDGSVAAQAVRPLIDSFDKQTEQVKGDILYVIGMCGDAEAIPFLRSVSAETANSEIREAAEDALEILWKR